MKLSNQPKLVLLYHRVRPESRIEELDRVLNTSVERFVSQMDLLAARARLIPLMSFVDGSAPEDGPLVAVTFDDGYLDVFEHALPVLRDRGIPATVFLTTGFVEGSVEPWWERLKALVGETNVPVAGQLPLYRRLEPRCRHLRCEERLAILKSAFGCGAADRRRSLGKFPSWAGIEEAASGGVVFENHTHSHPCLRRLSLEEATAEIILANDLIQRHTGRRPSLFAFPGGEPADVSCSSLRLLRRLGFAAAFTAGRKSHLLYSRCIPSWLHGGPRVLPRRTIRYDTDERTLLRWLACG